MDAQPQALELLTVHCLHAELVDLQEVLERQGRIHAQQDLPSVCPLAWPWVLEPWLRTSDDFGEGDRTDGHHNSW